MPMTPPYELIVTIVNRGFTDDVMDAARSQGAGGGTVLHARGSGIHEAEKFFGVSIQPEKEIVLVVVQRARKQAVMQAICTAAGLFTEGRGMSFSLPVDEVAGIVHWQQVDEQAPAPPR